MRIKSYKDLVGLSIAQARAAYDTTIGKYEVLVQTIVDVSAQRDTFKAEVERLTRVIASYDSPEVETARAIKLGRQINDEDAPVFAALAKSERDDAVKVDRLSEKPSKDSLRDVWLDIHDTKHGRPANKSKWTRRRLAQLLRLKQLGYAVEVEDGCWWPDGLSCGPQKNAT